MRRTMMKSKIHRATVTGSDLNYVGSITLDPVLMRLADVLEHEQVHVLDLDNGARFETYVMKGGQGDVIVNGAAARLVHPGDRVIVISYAQYDEAELESYAPTIVHVDSRNRPTDEELQGRGDGGFAGRRSRAGARDGDEWDIRELHELAP
jgi:aspartate 1-decarboxylase